MHSWTFAVVPTDIAIHQVSTKHSIFHVFILCGCMYVALQDESCRYCYDLCRVLRLFSLRAIWYMCTLLRTYAVVPTNIGIYHVSVKHTAVNILPCWYSVLCVCVFFPFILDIKFVGRTSRGHTGGRSHRIFHPPSFCGACLIFSREKDSAIPFPRRP